MSEQKLQTKIMKVINKRGGYCVDVITASKDGVHDILSCYRGYFLSIEVKYGYNQPSPLQLVNQELVKEAGGFSIIAWNLESVIKLLDYIEAI